MLGLVEAERAFTTIHPGAVYLHLGRSYEVEQLDIDGRRAVVSALRRRLVHAAEEGDRDLHRADPRAAHDRRGRAPLRRGLGDRAGDRLPAGLDLRPGALRHRRPRAARAAASSPRRSGTCCRTGSAGALPPDVLLGALHATEHGQIAVLPLIAMCDRWDIGGLSTNVHFQTGRSTIFIYDGHPGGVGITLRGYEQFERLLGDAERLIAECPCESGCPSCVQSPKCGNLNEPLHKAGRAGADGPDERSPVKGGSGPRRHEQQGGSVEAHSLPSERARQVAVIGSSRVRAWLGVWAAGGGGWAAAGRGRGDARLRRRRRCDGGGVRAARLEPAATVVGIVPGDSAAEANPYLHPRRRHRHRPGPQPRRRRLRRGRDRDRRRVGDAVGDRLRPRPRPPRDRPAQLDA